MNDDRYNPVPLDLEAELQEAFKRSGFKAAYDALEDEYAALSVFLMARKAVGLTQQQIAQRMGTTASAISRLESSLGNGRTSPSLATLRRYADAIGCKLELKLSLR
ncbi:MAG: helix-turn-helix transcriptional regulator [Magnetococcales bacterium]|nr:helix-turn-helix transcriptional regulator [Magnetococcales bacterium]